MTAPDDAAQLRRGLASRVLLGVAAATFGVLAFGLYLAAPATGLATLPLALLLTGLAIWLARGAPPETSTRLRWLIGIGLVGVLLEIVVLVALAIANSSIW